MNPEYLASLLATGAADDVAPAAPCPDEVRIAGYVDGALNAAARERVELHLADCTRCLELVGLLCRLRHSDAIEPVPLEVVAQARAVATEQPRHRWRPAPQWAAAAALVLAVPLLLQLGGNPDHASERQARPADPATRAQASPAEGLQVVSPGAGATVDPQRFSVRWTDIAATPYYDLRIVTDAGEVVIHERVSGTTWRPRSPLNLRPGAEYFVHVDAYPAGEKAVSSDHVPFRIAY